MNHKKKKVNDVIEAYHNKNAATDTLGSYTGNSIDTEKPIQDADDL